MTRTRKDVWTLTRAEGDWPAALVAYEQAVRTLRARDPAGGRPTDPLGWRFLAAIHGLAGPNGQPDTSDALWSQCQHESWFFLPWHRMYLLAFELAIQDALNDDSWSLPYWYALDPDDLSQAVLPPAFRDAGAGLHTPMRSSVANSGAPLYPLPDLQDLTQSVVDALEADVFSTPDGTSSFGGGERSTPSFRGQELGLLEDAPHGSVHMLVGNDYRNGQLVRSGWMGSFYTAGLDPVFWLHHANIDRLWQVWLDQDPTHLNPTGDPAWFKTKFSFPKVGGGVHTWSIRDVLDTVALGYKYESTTPPSGVSPPAGQPAEGGLDLGLGEVTVPERRPPQVLGATDDVPLATSEPVEVALSQPVDFGLALDGGAPPVAERAFLRIEGITGTAAAPTYAVYLNVPPGEAPSEHPEAPRRLLLDLRLGRDLSEGRVARRIGVHHGPRGHSSTGCPGAAGALGSSASSGFVPPGRARGRGSARRARRSRRASSCRPASRSALGDRQLGDGADSSAHSRYPASRPALVCAASPDLAPRAVGVRRCVGCHVRSCGRRDRGRSGNPGRSPTAWAARCASGDIPLRDRRGRPLSGCWCLDRGVCPLDRDGGRNDALGRSPLRAPCRDAQPLAPSSPGDGVFRARLRRGLARHRCRPHRSTGCNSPTAPRSSLVGGGSPCGCRMADIPATPSDDATLWRSSGACHTAMARRPGLRGDRIPGGAALHVRCAGR